MSNTCRYARVPVNQPINACSPSSGAQTTDEGFLIVYKEVHPHTYLKKKKTTFTFHKVSLFLLNFTTYNTHLAR